MFNQKELELLSEKYNMAKNEILMIALNRYGVMNDTQEHRIRLTLRFNGLQNDYFFAINVNTMVSPFTLVDDILYFDGRQVARVVEREQDTCVLSYFRRNKTELTINSNRRNNCKGCKFCSAYTLKPENDNDLMTEEKVIAHMKNVMAEKGMKDLSQVLRVTVCTGCFKDENALVEHLIMLKNALGKLGFNKRIRYIGSQLRSEEALQKIKDNIEHFSLSLTLECFERRDEMMKRVKASLDLEKIKSILSKAKEMGFSSNFLYILGLDRLETFKKNYAELKPCINRFPVVQVMQNYSSDQEDLRCEEGKTIEYYIEARKYLEDLFKDTEMRPRAWENYRCLFYETFADEVCTSMKK